MMSFTLLKKGSKGSDVKCLQTALLGIGIGIGSDTLGTFGTGTENAVKTFQKKNGLTVDGKAGVNTQHTLYAPIGQALIGCQIILEDSTYFERLAGLM